MNKMNKMNTIKINKSQNMLIKTQLQRQLTVYIEY